MENGARELVKQGQRLLERMDPDLLDDAESHVRRALALARGVCGRAREAWTRARAQGRSNECSRVSGKLWDKPLVMSRSDSRSLTCCKDAADSMRRCRAIKDAESLDSNNARLHAHLGKLAIARGRFAEAAERFQAALALDSTLAEARSGLGRALEEQGRLEAAEQCFRDALQSDPSLTTPLIALAKLQADRGEFEESCGSARRALAICPNLAEAYWRLAMNLKGALPDADIQAMQRLRDHKYVAHGLRAGLGFALGAVFDARGLYGQAAEQFSSANALKAAVKAAKGQSFDPDQYSHSIDRIIATFTPELLARGRGWGERDPRPVFVVGLPRSGTTLVEQILASHPQVHGAGELHDMLNLFNALPELAGRPGVDAFEAVSTLGPDSAPRWLGDISRRSIGSRRRPSSASSTKCPTTF